MMCDAAGLAPLALMCGVFWPCPETRAGDFSSRKCVCGRKSSRGSLTLHFCFGPCPCAVNSRARWKQRVAEAFQWCARASLSPLDFRLVVKEEPVASSTS